MARPIYTVDAFTEKPFAGNPAGVCPLDAAPEESWMRNVAAEMNLSETAFFWPENGDFRLRWFTPTVEVALCGHATLASAHVLWETKRLQRNEVARFQSLSGLLTAKCRDNEIELDFPAKPLESVTAPEGLIEALGARSRYVGKNNLDYLIELKTEENVRALKPDLGRIARFPVRGIIVTAVSKDSRFDFISRFFAPGAGVDEDPVTGSAHCALGPYWQARLGKSEFTSFQASRRGGMIRVKVVGDRVLLGGHAVTILRGELCV
jgi:PhzF family phenazine biosynthesis protein